LTRHHKALGITAALVASAMLLTACSSSGSSGGASVSSTTTKAKFFNLLPKSIQQSKTLTMVNYIDPPIYMESASGQISGVQQDFVNALEPLLGVTIKQVAVSSFATILTSLQSDRYQVTWGGLADIPTQEAILPTIPWTWSAPTFIYPAGKNYSTALDLCGLKLATLTGSAPILGAIATISTLCAKAGKPKPSTTLLQNRSEEELAVQDGRADAFGDLPFGAAYIAKQQPGKWKYFDITKAPFVVLQLGAGVEKGNPQLAKAFYAAIKELWTDGTYQSIMTKWGLTAFEVTRPVLNPIANHDIPANGTAVAG
jgi:polar amino acid transport system substrate-binding protein